MYILTKPLVNFHHDFVGQMKLFGRPFEHQERQCPYWRGEPSTMSHFSKSKNNHEIIQLEVLVQLVVHILALASPTLHPGHSPVFPGNVSSRLCFF